MIKVVSSKILVEEVKIKKVRAIIVPGQSQEDWDVTYTVLQVGPTVPEGWEHVVVGVTPIFSQYVQFSSVKVIEKTKAKTVIHVIVDITDVIAIEEKEVELQDVDDIEVIIETVIGEEPIDVNFSLDNTVETITGDDAHLGDPDTELHANVQVDNTNNEPENDVQDNNPIIL